MSPPTRLNIAGGTLTKRRKLCLSALVGTAGAAGLLALSGAGAGSDRWDPEVAEGLVEVGTLGRRRALANTVENYDTSQEKVLPSFYDNVANVWDVQVEADQPAFWYIPKAGGNTMSKIMTHCLHFVSANSMPRMLEGGLEPIDHMQVNELSDGGKYINLDMSLQADITRAKNWFLVQSNKADVITSQHLKEVTDLFTSDHRGRLFVFLRYPVKRAVDYYFYRQSNVRDPNFDKEVATVGLKNYIRSDRTTENLVVRTLVGKNGFDVTDADVETAKHILRRKFLVGIAEEKLFDISIVRFEKYFGWWEKHEVLTNMTVNYCHYNTTKNGGHFGKHPKVKSSSDEYNRIASRDWADMELYMYAKGLFDKQKVLA